MLNKFKRIVYRIRNQSDGLSRTLAWIVIHGKNKSSVYYEVHSKHILVPIMQNKLMNCHDVSMLNLYPLEGNWYYTYNHHHSGQWNVVYLSKKFLKWYTFDIPYDFDNFNEHEKRIISKLNSIKLLYELKEDDNVSDD